MEFIENMTFGIGIAAALVTSLAILFWLPVVAAIGIVVSGMVATVYFASGRRNAGQSKLRSG